MEEKKLELKTFGREENPDAALRVIIADLETKEVIEDVRVYALHGAMIAEREHGGKKVSEGFSISVAKNCAVVENYRIIWLLRACIRKLKSVLKEARRR